VASRIALDAARSRLVQLFHHANTSGFLACCLYLQLYADAKPYLTLVLVADTSPRLGFLFTCGFYANFTEDRRAVPMCRHVWQILHVGNTLV
jgi:hypothetical protein